MWKGVYRKLSLSLKNINQKIKNIVNVITETGSPALLQTLTELENEKQRITQQLDVEKNKMKADQLNEEEIIAAYQLSQKMFEDGTLPQRKQLINLYLKRVLVYPEFVKIELNNVPANLLKVPVQSDDVLGKNFGGKNF